MLRQWSNASRSWRDPPPMGAWTSAKRQRGARAYTKRGGARGAPAMMSTGNDTPVTDAAADAGTGDSATPASTPAPEPAPEPEPEPAPAPSCIEGDKVAPSPRRRASRISRLERVHRLHRHWRTERRSWKPSGRPGKGAYAAARSGEAPRHRRRKPFRDYGGRNRGGEAEGGGGCSRGRDVRRRRCWQAGGHAAVCGKAEAHKQEMDKRKAAREARRRGRGKRPAQRTRGVELGQEARQWAGADDRLRVVARAARAAQNEADRDTASDEDVVEGAIEDEARAAERRRQRHSYRRGRISRLRRFVSGARSRRQRRASAAATTLTMALEWTSQCRQSVRLPPPATCTARSVVTRGRRGHCGMQARHAKLERRGAAGLRLRMAQLRRQGGCLAVVDEMRARRRGRGPGMGMRRACVPRRSASMG